MTIEVLKIEGDDLVSAEDELRRERLRLLKQFLESSGYQNVTIETVEGS